MTAELIPCMAVKQPGATLLVSGIKDVENRDRAMPEQLKGRWCAIYASRTMALVGSWAHASHLAPDFALWRRASTSQFRDLKEARKQCIRGAVVGLVKWFTSDPPYRGPLVLGRHPKGPWAEPNMHHWTYSDQIALSVPVPLLNGGRQSLHWYLNEGVVLAIRAQLAAPDRRNLLP